jgi:hypothetical protein
VLRRFDVLRPARTVQNESRQGAGLANNYPVPVFRKRENAPVLQDPIKSPLFSEAGTHFRKNYAQAAWQPPATFSIFLAETQVVIQVKIVYKRFFVNVVPIINLFTENAASQKAERFPYKSSHRVRR